MIKVIDGKVIIDNYQDIINVESFIKVVTDKRFHVENQNYAKAAELRDKEKDLCNRNPDLYTNRSYILSNADGLIRDLKIEFLVD